MTLFKRKVLKLQSRVDILKYLESFDADHKSDPKEHLKKTFKRTFIFTKNFGVRQFKWKLKSDG